MFAVSVLVTRGSHTVETAGWLLVLVQGFNSGAAACLPSLMMANDGKRNDDDDGALESVTRYGLR